MVFVYVLAGSIAGIGMAVLAAMSGASPVVALLAYWLTCSLATGLVALVYVRLGDRQPGCDTAVPKRQLKARRGAMPPRRVFGTAGTTD